MQRAIDRIGCSTISFRNKPFTEALAATNRLGLSGIDLGGLPGVCEHVPTPLGGHAEEIVRAVGESGLRTWALNIDAGAMNDPSLDEEHLRHTAHELIALAARLKSAIILPCGAQSRTPFVDDDSDLDLLARRLRAFGRSAAESGVRLWVEGLHHFRFCHNTERAAALLEGVPPELAGFVFDVSHVVAGEIDEVALVSEFADRIEHVHLRDAVAGDINRSIGLGEADFGGVIRALTDGGYTGSYVLELETHDVAEEQREASAAIARDVIAAMLAT